MKEKSATFYVLKLKAKEKANFSEIIGEEGDFSVENLGLFFQSQCLLTPLPGELVVMD